MNEKRKVTIFGAGVAGLTAAHELVIRGFDVMVIDPNLNVVVGSRTNDRGLGGMARSQFVVDTGTGDAEMTQLRPATDFLRDASIQFDFTAENPVLEARPRDALEKLLALVEELKPYKLRKLQIHLPRSQATNKQPPENDPRVVYFAELMKLSPATLVKSCVTFTDLPGFEDSYAFFSTMYSILPAEHGFRFFPSFYRHLFDTMKRTPVDVAGAASVAPRSVYDNLVPVQNLGFARAGAKTSFTIPRSPLTSLDELRRNLDKVLTELDWSGPDLARFGLTLFQYMTSCTERRARDYEHMSWSDFVGLEHYGDVMREHIEYGPQMMASLRGSASDARTQGTIVVQLLMDYLRQGTRPDSILAGPTSGMWFNHWHDYLVEQGVQFRAGKVDGFDDARNPVAVGRFDSEDFEEMRLEENGWSRVSIKEGYVVFALPIGPMTELAKKWCAPPCGHADGHDDMHRLCRFMGDAHPTAGKRPRGPLRHMSGIQYYFDNEVTFWSGHTQYLDSEWGLTSISQPQFWLRPRDATDAYRSLLSVDLGIWDRPSRTMMSHGIGLTAEVATPMQIAREVWAQIRDHHDQAFKARYGDAAFPEPRAFALDQGLHFGDKGLVDNAYPFVVNEVGKFALRPGALAAQQPKAAAHYEVLNDRFVMAGTHMKTFTRITSMESANESARHAVNAILQHAHVACDRCDIWDPEDYELADLTWLKELDAELFRRGLPHFVHVLGWTDLPAALSHDVAFASLVKGASIR